MRAVSRRSHQAGAVPLARVTIIAQALIALAVAVFLFTSSGVRLPLVDRADTLTVQMDDASGLDPSDHPVVTVGGVKAGTVSSVRFDRATRRADVVLRVDHGIRDKLFADARARVLPRSALNDLVVDIDPGDPSAGHLRGGTIGRSAPPPVGYDRVLGVLDADTRAYVQVLVGTLHQVLDGRTGPLGDALDRLPDTTVAARRVATVLAARRRDLSQLVADLDRIATATGRRGDDLTEAIRLARRTLDVTAARQQQLSAGITGLPALAAQGGETARSIVTLSAPLDSALGGLRPTARNLTPTLRRLRALLPTLRGTLGDLETLGRKTRRPLGLVRRDLRQLTPAVAGLQPTVPYLTGLVDQLSKNTRPLRELVENWPGALSGTNGFATHLRSKALGVLPVLPAMFGLNGSAAGSSDLRQALGRVRRSHPGVVDDARSQPLVLTSAKALLGLLCTRHNAGACSLLSLVDRRPPKVIDR